MRFFYTIGIYVYTLGIRVAALCGHRKAGEMVRGWRDCNIQAIKQSSNQAIKRVWFHAASLGEFEQARPVLEALRRRHPEWGVLVTFFSPSGYEVRKNYAEAEAVRYLPMDTPRNVRRMLDAWQPEMVFFVKYEFWFNYLGELRRRGIPTYIFSAIFRPGQYFFKWYGGWFARQLKECFTHVFVQNEESLKLLRGVGVVQCSLAGDTRFDRVHQIAEAAEGNEVVEAFLKGHEGKVLVAGSTWPPDETLIKECVNALMCKCVSADTENTSTITQSNNNAIKIILAPHVIAEEHLEAIERLFPDSERYSKLKNEDLKLKNNSGNHNVLIVDNIGLLSKLYRYGDVAYIGGGFGVGIHNILEAVTFGKPVLFGPNYHKFQEAKDIIARGGGWSVEGEELKVVLERLLGEEEFYARASQACMDYMNENLGSTEKILVKIEN